MMIVRAALAIAMEEYPDLDIDSYLSQLDTLAARVEVLAGYDRSPLNVLQSLNGSVNVGNAVHMVVVRTNPGLPARPEPSRHGYGRGAAPLGNAAETRLLHAGAWARRPHRL